MPENLIEVKIGANVEATRRGVAEAKGHIDGLLGQLKEFKSETVQTGRQARFFAAELTSIIPAAEGARSILKELFAVGLAGGGIGMAIEGVKFLVSAFHELGEEERKAGEDFKKFVEDGEKQTAQLRTSIERTLLAMRGATRAQLLDFDQLEELRNKEAGLLAQLAVARTNLTAAQDAETTASGEAALGLAIETAAREKAVKVLEGQLAAVKRLMAGKDEPISELAGEDAANAAAEAREKDAEDLAKWRAFQLAEWKKYYDRQTELATKAVQDDFDAREKEELDLAKLRADEMKEWKKHYDKITKDTTDTVQAAFDEQERKVKAIAHTLGSAFGSFFSDVITGTRSVGDAFQAMANRILDAIMGSLFSKLAGGIAGSLLGGIGLPFLEEGGTLITAAQGVDLPDVPGPIPIIAHGGETVVTRRTTNRLDDFLDRFERADGRGGAMPMANPDRGSGGGEVHAHFHLAGPVDGDTFRRFVESDGFRRAMREATRNGLL